MAPAATFGVKFTAGVFIWIDFQGEQRGGGGVSRHQQSIEGGL